MLSTFYYIIHIFVAFYTGHICTLLIQFLNLSWSFHSETFSTRQRHFIRDISWTTRKIAMLLPSVTLVVTNRHAVSPLLLRTVTQCHPCCYEPSRSVTLVVTHRHAVSPLLRTVTQCHPRCYEPSRSVTSWLTLSLSPSARCYEPSRSVTSWLTLSLSPSDRCYEPSRSVTLGCHQQGVKFKCWHGLTPNDTDWHRDNHIERLTRSTCKKLPYMVIDGVILLTG